MISAKKAIMRVYEGKADVIDNHPTFVVRSVTQAWPIPTQIILKKHVKSRPTFRVPAILNKRNIHIRDKYTCQYCGRHRSRWKEHEFPTIDHVIPQSKGGKHVWENVLTACSTCNNKKADYTIDEIGMKPLKKPTTPTMFEIWSKTNTKRYED